MDSGGFLEVLRTTTDRIQNNNNVQNTTTASKANPAAPPKPVAGATPVVDECAPANTKAPAVVANRTADLTAPEGGTKVPEALEAKAAALYKAAKAKGEEWIAAILASFPHNNISGFFH